MRPPAEDAGRHGRAAVQCPACGALTIVPGSGGAMSATVLPAAPPPDGAPAAGFPPGPPTTGFGGTGQYPSPAAGGYPLAPADRMALDRVAPPATALIVVACLGILFDVFVMLAMVHVAINPLPANQRPGLNREDIPLVVTAWVTYGLANVAVNVLILVGAVKMKKLRNYPLAMAVSILALIPCVGPCCLFGIPFGIWALIALCDDSVRMAFRS